MKIINYNDVSFVLGKNSKENWELLDEYSKTNCNYVWFHLNSFPLIILTSALCKNYYR